MPQCGDQHQTTEENKGRRRKYGRQNDEIGSDYSEEQTKEPWRGGFQDKEDEYRSTHDITPSDIPLPNIKAKKMERGISKATENELLVIEARNKVEQDFESLALGPDVSHIQVLRNGKHNQHSSTDVSQATTYPPLIQDVNCTPAGAWVSDGVQRGLRSGGNSPNSPNGRDGILPHSQYRSEDIRNSPNNAYVAGGGIVASNNTGFIETPVYTFILPDLTRYPGNISATTTL